MCRSKAGSSILVIFVLFAISRVAISNGTAKGDSVTFPSIDGFQIAYNYPVYYPDNLWDLIDGAADAFVAYGFVNLHIAEYVQGDLHIKAEVYRHKNSVLAYGMYAAERSSDYRFIPLGVQGYAENSLVFFVKGPYYVKVTGYEDDEQAGTMVMNIARAIEKSLSGETTLPQAFGKFPTENQQKNSEHYIPENFIGYSFLNEAFTVEYSLEDQTFTAFLIQTGDTRSVIEMVNKLKEKAVHSENISEGIIRLEDKYNGNLFLLTLGNQLLGTMGQADKKIMIRFLIDFKRAFK